MSTIGNSYCQHDIKVTNTLGKSPSSLFSNSMKEAVSMSPPATHSEFVLDGTTFSAEKGLSIPGVVKSLCERGSMVCLTPCKW